MSTEMAVRGDREVQAPAVVQQAMTLGEQVEYAKVLIGSGLLPKHIATPAQAVAVIAYGREMGLPMMQAMNNLYVGPGGKVTCDAKTMLAVARKSGALAYCRVTESDGEHATVAIMRKDDPKEQVVTFTIADAAALGLAAKDNYKKQAAVMLAWRAISKALRLYASDAIGGLYTHEEMGLPVRVEAAPNGDSDIVLDAELVAQPAPAVYGTPTAPQESAPAPVCPKCKGPLWDNREQRKQDEADVAAGTRTKKPRAAWSCKDKACGGAIWESSPKPKAEEPQREPTIKDYVDTIKAICERIVWTGEELTLNYDKRGKQADWKTIAGVKALLEFAQTVENTKHMEQGASQLPE